MEKVFTIANLRLFLIALYHEPWDEVFYNVFYRIIGRKQHSIFKINDVKDQYISGQINIGYTILKKVVFIKGQITGHEKDVKIDLIYGGQKINTVTISKNQQEFNIVTRIQQKRRSCQIQFSDYQNNPTVKITLRRQKYYDQLPWDDQVDISKLLLPPSSKYYYDENDNLQKDDAKVPDLKDPNYDNDQSVTIIIPTKDQVDLLQKCVESIFAYTHVQPFTILIIDNNSEEPPTKAYLNSISAHEQVTVLTYHHPYNYAAMHNWVMQYVNTEYICFLNNDIEIITANWLSSMVINFQLSNIGAVGCLLLYPDGRIQHDGIYFGSRRGHDFVDHLNKGRYPTDRGLYMPHQPKYVIGVTAACMLTKKSIFTAVKGFDAENFPIAFNDVDYCLKLINYGFQIIQVSDIELTHYESISRQPNVEEEKFAFKKIIDKHTVNVTPI